MEPPREERLARADGNGGSVCDVVIRLRDSEPRHSQARKERLTGLPVPEVFGEGKAPVLGTSPSHDSTVVALSPSDTTRESTLPMLCGLPDDALPEKPIRERVRRLRKNDQRHGERIVALLGTA